MPQACKLAAQVRSQASPNHSRGGEQRVHLDSFDRLTHPQMIASDDVLNRGLHSVGQESITWLPASRAVNFRAWI